MPKLSSAAACGLVLTLMPAQAIAATPHAPGTCVDSPQAKLTVCVAADARGPWYEVYRGNRTVIAHARLGLVLDGFGNEPASRVTNARRTTVDQSWEQPWGEQRIIQDRHAELRVTLQGPTRHAPNLSISSFGHSTTASVSATSSTRSPPRAMSRSSTSSPSSGSLATGMPGGTRHVIPIATNTSTSAHGCTRCTSRKRR